MNTLRVLASLRIWGPVLGIVAVLARVFSLFREVYARPERKVAGKVAETAG
jgi:hypothetical protein